MQALRVHQYGQLDSLRLDSVPDLEIGPEDVGLDLLMSPISPADLNFIDGSYGVRLPLPAVPGNEGVGRIRSGGEANGQLAEGRLAIVPNHYGFWCEEVAVPAADLILLPEGIDVEQASMLAINPPTAWRLLHDFMDLKPGDWVIQNAANSAVGRWVIHLAKALGFRTVNVVRRESLIPELTALGADIVVTDEAGFGKRVKEQVDGAAIRLALNAVGGDNAREMTKALSNGATVVTYGAMSMQPLTVGNGQLIFKDLRFRGFWITAWYRQASQTEQSAMFDALLPLCTSDAFRIPVAATYDIADFADAIAAAQGSGRNGKVLLKLQAP